MKKFSRRRRRTRAAARTGRPWRPVCWGRAHVLDAVRDRVRQLLHRGRPRLLQVVARDRDRVELRVRSCAHQAMMSATMRSSRGPVGRCRCCGPGIPSRRSFWIVPVSFAAGTPCSSAATTYIAMIGSAAPFIVIETDILSSGMPSNRIFMSSMSRSPRPPCRRRRRRADGPSRSRGASPGRRPPTARLAGGEVAAIEGVGVLGGREAGVLAHGPRAVWHTSWRARRGGTGRSPGRVGPSAPRGRPPCRAA